MHVGIAGLEQPAEPIGRQFVEVIRVIDGLLGKHTLDEVKPAVRLIVVRIDLKAQQTGQLAREDKRKVAPLVFAMLQSAEAVCEKVP